MNKNDLISAVADSSGLTRSDATKAVEGVFDAITGALKSGDEVRLVGFGTFSVAKRKASTGRNPRTGETMQIKASTRFDSWRRIRRAVRKHPDITSVVEYNRFFGDPEAASLRAVLEHLGLPWEPNIAAEFDRVHREYATSVSGRDRTLSGEQQALVDELADRRLWDVVVRLSS